eukprot:CAMPEP_0184702530 /NCGR_PEP_ID=MMETSP0313-20130426/24558_1 /TAXON_ID=2792 /ORGANISM="Porphyridium aerugineum, Strain SAG 1380-2" /LENGTH=59 /DNA_ID=CAMNT_0027163033 /DNA_START=36 /DNA_END=215 /DNA_ORIENTATION=-
MRCTNYKGTNVETDFVLKAYVYTQSFRFFHKNVMHSADDEWMGDDRADDIVLTDLGTAG